MAAHGSISTSHHLATEAGASTLRSGGNALDAALAAAAVLCVIYPHNVALGGDLVALVKDPSGKVHFLNATGTAPNAVDANDLRLVHGDALPLRGVDSITVPGGVRGWEELHNLGANLSWADHMHAAINFADCGVPVARSVRAALVAEGEHLLSDPGASEIFAPGGALLAEGEILTQPALANTLRRIAEHGADEFYRGETATNWVNSLRELGCQLSLADAANYRPQFDEPIESNFDAFRIVTSPPNTSGFILTRAMNRVKEGISAPLSTGVADLVAELNRGNVVRSVFLADPNFGAKSGHELVNLDYEGAAAKAITPTGDTVGLSAVSADGWAISLINSLFFRFGACILDPATGVLFQNRGTSFSLDPTSANVVAPGKRPSHTLMPVLVFRGNELVYVPSTMGGAGQPQIHTQLLLRMFAGASPEEAIAAPRFLVKEPNDAQISVIVEADLDPVAVQALRLQNYAIEKVPPHTELLGHSNIIEIIEDGYRAASDPRSDGSAVTVHEYPE